MELEKAAFTIYYITFIISILLFGAVHTYVYTFMSLGILTGSLLLLKKNIRKDPKTGAYHLKFPSNSLDFAFLGMMIVLIFQVIPLPEGLLGFLSPEAKVVGGKTLAASGMITHPNQTKEWFALSTYAYPVRMSIVRWTVYGLFFLGLTQVLNSRKRIEVMVFIILLTGCFEALYGLAETYSGSNHIWWFKKKVGINDITGTYINRNHFAGLMEMGLLLAAAYVAGLTGRRKKRKVDSNLKDTLKVKISRALSGEQRFNKRLFVLFSGVVLGIGLVFSASRAGMIAAAGALLSMSLFLVLRTGYRRKGFIILFLFLITSVYAIRIGVEYPMERFRHIDVGLEKRAVLAQKTMDMFRDYRITGVGVGNFQYAYPKYQSVEFKKAFVRFAHNDWAQFLAEAGIIGFCLFLAGMFYYLYRVLKLWKRRGDPFAVCLGLAPLGAVTAMGVHSYFDFNLHIPANALMLVAVMATGYSALHLERHHGRERMLYKYYDMPLRFKGGFVLFLTFGLILWSGYWAIRHFMAEAYCNTVPNSTLNRDQNPPLEEIDRAIAWDRGNAAYWFKKVLELNRMRNAEVGMRNDVERDRKQLEIIEVLEEAVRLNPFNAKYHLRLGWEYTFLWRESNYHQKWLPAADISMDRAAYFTGVKNPNLHVEMGNYWTMRSKTIYPSNPAHHTAWAKSSWHYKKAQEIDGNRGMLKRITQYIWNFYPDREMVLEAVQERFLGQAEKMLGD